MQKPTGIDLTAALMGLFILLDVIVLFVVPAPPVPAGGSAMPMASLMAAAKGVTIVVAIIEAVFVFFYWKGQNWARWLVMIDAVFVLLGLIRITKTMAYSPMLGGLAIAKALLAIYLLYFLNTPAIKAWFASPKLALPPDGTVPPSYGV